MTETNDDRLWRMARKRAEFRRSLYSYFVINIFLWLVWWFTAGKTAGFSGFPWPAWVSLGWGVDVAMKYYAAYYGNHKDLTEREYERLKRKQENQ